jgi:hypothetical protein
MWSFSLQPSSIFCVEQRWRLRQEYIHGNVGQHLLTVENSMARDVSSQKKICENVTYISFESFLLFYSGFYTSVRLGTPVPIIFSYVWVS